MGVEKYSLWAIFAVLNKKNLYISYLFSKKAFIMIPVAEEAPDSLGSILNRLAEEDPVFAQTLLDHIMVVMSPVLWGYQKTFSYRWYL